MWHVSELFLLSLAVSNMRLQQKLQFLFNVKKYSCIKKRRPQKLMAFINQVLLSFEMRKYAEISIKLKTITKAPRRIWALDKDESWFEDFWGNKQNRGYMNRWKEHFLMSGRTFAKLVNLLHCSLEKEDAYLRKAIRVKERISVSLWRLAMEILFGTTN